MKDISRVSATGWTQQFSWVTTCHSCSSVAVVSRQTVFSKIQQKKLG